MKLPPSAQQEQQQQQQEEGLSDWTEVTTGGSSHASTQVVGGGGSSSAVPPTDDTITINTSFEMDKYAMNEAHATYLAIELKACGGGGAMTRERTPMDLVVVLDKSRSMLDGGKLDVCKKTVRYILTQLTPKDRVSLVFFSTDVVPYDFVTVDQKGKDQIERLIASTEAAGCTNLSGGLFAGIQNVSHAFKQDHSRVQSIMLLTDGLANVGLQDCPDIIKALGPSMYQMPNLSIYTFGYGSDHNAEMLASIAGCGHGMYYFVPSVDAVSSCFADCLGGLLSLVAQNVTVTIDAINGMVIDEVVDSKRPVRALSPGRSYQVAMGDMMAEEEKTILLRVTLPANQGLTSGLASCARLHCSYMDIIHSMAVDKDVMATVQRPDGRDMSTVVKSGLVLYNMCRVRTAKALEQAKSVADVGRDFEGARRIIEDAKVQCQNSLEALTSTDTESCDYVTMFLRDLDQALASLSDQSSYRIVGHAYLASAAQGHYAQRSNAGKERESKYRKTGKAKQLRVVGKFFGTLEEADEALKKSGDQPLV